MSDIIKVKNLPKIAEQADAIGDFSEAVLSAGNETQRQFNIKTSDAELETLNMFLEKLNSLQVYVLDDIPRILKDYSKALLSFYTSVTGKGFEVKAWTSASGVETVKSYLSNQQQDEVKKVKDTLQKALDQATELLGVESVELGTILKRVDQELLEEAQERQAIHDSVQGAHDTLSSSLDSIITELQDVIPKISGLTSITRFSAGTILPAMKSGRLSQDKFFYLENAKSDYDAKAIQMILSDKPSKVLSLDPDKLDDRTYYVMHYEISDWYQKKNETLLNELVGEMGVTNRNKLEKFSTNLLVAGAVRGGEVDASLWLSDTELKGTSDSEKRKELVAKHLDLEKQEKAINNINGLLQFIVLAENPQTKLGVGKIKNHTVAMPNATVNMDSHSKLKVRIEESGNIRVERRDVLSYLGKESEGLLIDYTSTLDKTSQAAGITFNQDKLVKLKEKQAKAISIGLASVLLSVVGGLEGFQAIEAMDKTEGFVEVFKNYAFVKPAINGNAPTSISSLINLMDFGGSKGQKHLANIAKTLANIGADRLAFDKSYNSDNSDSIRKKISDLIIDKGAWRMQMHYKTKDGDVHTAMGTDTYYFDYKSALKLHEINTYGMSKSSVFNSEVIDDYKTLLEQAGINDKNIQDLLLGTHEKNVSHQNLEDLNDGQIQEFVNGLNILSDYLYNSQDGFEHFAKELGQHYEVTPTP